MMVKSWSRLCLLVLAISSLSRGLNDTVAPPDDEGRDATTESPDSSPLGETPSTSPQNWTSTNVTDAPTTTITSQENSTFAPEHGGSGHSGPVDTEGGNVTTATPTTTAGDAPGSGREGDGADAVTATVSTATASTSPKPARENEPQSSWAYVILVLILLVIIALCVILFLLRRAARTYSFDLQRPVPVNHLDEPTGTFEAVYLDDLDRPDPKVTTDDTSPPPVANGTSSKPEEKDSNAPQEQSDANGLTGETSPTTDTSPTVGDDPADKTSSPLSSTDLFFDAVGEEHQSENNNPSVCSSDPFVEINLDDPAWCDQLLTSPEAPSSVLPFTPFSFSSSTSS